jgi:hypothetical protein
LFVVRLGEPDPFRGGVSSEGKEGEGNEEAHGWTAWLRQV